MKSVAKIVVIIFGVILFAAALTLAGFALIPPESYEPKPRDLRDESEYQLEEKVGWYVFDDNSHRMITWGAEKALTINRFDSLARNHLTPKTVDTFIWLRKGDRENYQMKFKRNENGNVVGMEWTDEGGQERTARRLRNYNYAQQEVRYFNGDTELVGLLMKPVVPGPHPAVAFIHGSGVSDRNNFWYLYQADYLAKSGVEVLLPDKRGCGKSGGTWHDASFADFAGDALAAVDYLKNSEAVDTDKIGLLGISQGGWIGPLAASKSSDVRFLINVSGSATTVNEQLSHEITADIRNAGIPGFMASLIEPVFSRRVKKRREIWWEQNGNFDPLPYWRKLKLPILVVYGKKDEDDNVPVSRSVSFLEAAKSASQNPHFHIKVYEESGHAMGDPSTGWIRHDYLEMLADWIHQITATN